MNPKRDFDQIREYLHLITLNDCQFAYTYIYKTETLTKSNRRTISYLLFLFPKTFFNIILLDFARHFICHNLEEALSTKISKLLSDVFFKELYYSDRLNIQKVASCGL